MRVNKLGVVERIDHYKQLTFEHFLKFVSSRFDSSSTLKVPAHLAL